MRSPGVKQDWVVELRLARLVGQLMHISRYRSNLKDHLSRQIHFDFVFRAEVEFNPKKMSSPGFFPGYFLSGKLWQITIGVAFCGKCNANCDWPDVPGEYPGESLGEDI